MAESTPILISDLMHQLMNNYNQQSAHYLPTKHQGDCR